MKKPLVVGNWKLNPVAITDAQTLARAVATKTKRYAPAVDVVVAPPFPFLSEVARTLKKHAVQLGAQDVFFEESGPHTGEVSAGMLQDIGVQYVIVGHSERRARGETDEVVAQKTIAALRRRLTPIVCIGEHARDARGDFYTVVAKQLAASLQGVSSAQVAKLVIAYEPVWAISAGDGKGKTATPEDVEEMALFIFKELAKHYNRTTARRVRLLYGGSVNPQNAPALGTIENIGGFLVGGASLRPDDFAAIVKNMCI